MSMKEDNFVVGHVRSVRVDHEAAAADVDRKSHPERGLYMITPMNQSESIREDRETETGLIPVYDAHQHPAEDAKQSERYDPRRPEVVQIDEQPGFVM